MFKYLSVIACLVKLISPGALAVSYFHVEQYTQLSQNPFLTSLVPGAVYLQNFETPKFDNFPYNTLSTPYVTGWNGSIATGPDFWGFQGDNTGSNPGNTWTGSIRTSATDKLPSGIHFDFSPDLMGRYPEYVGASLLGFEPFPNSTTIWNTILVYDANGLEVTLGGWRIPSQMSRPQSELFTTFDGIYVPGGISRIHFRDFAEVDHLTYGYAIPESSAGVLTLAGGL